MKGTDLVALLNNWLPLDGSTQIGEFELERGAALRKNPEDSFSCTVTWHDLNVRLNDYFAVAGVSWARPGGVRSANVDPNSDLAIGTDIPLRPREGTRSAAPISPRPPSRALPSIWRDSPDLTETRGGL